MKTLWLLNHYAQEPNGPGGTRHFSLARHLKNLGWRVVIIASSIEHGTGRQRLNTGESVRIEEHEGVTFAWLGGSSYRDNGWARLRNIAEYCLSAHGAHRLALPKPDIVLGSSVHPFAAFVAQRLAKHFDVPFVFEVRDLWPETLISMGRLERNSVPARLMRALESFLYRHASLILTLLPKADTYIAGLGIDTGKVRWLPNGVDIGAFPEGLDKRRGGQPFTFMYLGSHGIANGLEPILEAFASLAKDEALPPMCLRLVGDGPRKAALIELAAQLGLHGRVSFEDPVPKGRIPDLAAEADAFIANIRDLPLYQYGISLNKLFDYLAAGRPTILATGAINNPIEEAQAGISAGGDDAQGLAQAMRQILLATPEDREAMGQRGRRHVEETYEYRGLAAKLATWLDSLVIAGKR